MIKLIRSRQSLKSSSICRKRITFTRISDFEIKCYSTINDNNSNKFTPSELTENKEPNDIVNSKTELENEKSLLHGLTDTLGNLQTTLSQWNNRLQVTNNELNKLEKSRSGRGRWHRELFFIAVCLFHILLFLNFNLFVSDVTESNMKQQIATTLQDEGSHTMYLLSLYSQKPPKDIRETQALNREKFYSNRELSRLSFEKVSLEQKVQETKS